MFEFKDKSDDFMKGFLEYHNLLSKCLLMQLNEKGEADAKTIAYFVNGFQREIKKELEIEIIERGWGND